MNLFRRTLLLLLLFAGATTLRADPENFMVSEFLFVRPAAWKWTETRTDAQPVLRIVLHYDPAKKTGDPTATHVRWRGMFETEGRTDSRKTMAIGTNTVTYIEVQGTHQKSEGKKTHFHSHYALCGVVIPHPNGNVGIRMIGPKALVERSRGEFKKMIESALLSE
jgi:hypothetical protein